MAWLSGWKYRKEIHVGSATDVTDYQFRIVVGESPDTTGTDINCISCLPTFDDIRFTTSDGTTVINYWIEDIFGSYPNFLATIWVKIPLITLDTKIYMYSGNETAFPGSAGESTFLFFDDVSTDKSSNYPVVGVGGVNGTGTLTWDGDRSYSLRVTKEGHINAVLPSVGEFTNVAIHTIIYRETDTSNQQGGISLFRIPNAFIFCRYIKSPLNVIQITGDVSAEKSYHMPYREAKKLRVHIGSTKIQTDWLELDNTLIQSLTATIPTSVYDRYSFGLMGAHDVNSITRFKKIFIRKALETEPTILTDYDFERFVDFFSTDSMGVAPLSVQFFPRVTQQFESFIWDFGDGTYSTEVSPSHEYTQEGVYNVSITGIDSITGSKLTKRKIQHVIILKNDLVMRIPPTNCFSFWVPSELSTAQITTLDQELLEEENE